MSKIAKRIPPAKPEASKNRSYPVKQTLNLLIVTLLLVIGCSSQTITSGGGSGSTSGNLVTTAILPDTAWIARQTVSNTRDEWLISANGNCRTYASRRTGAIIQDCGSGFQAVAPKHRHWKLEEIKSSAKLIQVAELAPVNYVTRAKQIHLHSAATETADMLATLNELGAKIYNQESVSQYLYDKAHEKGANVSWVWKPMREEDLNIEVTGQDHPARFGNEFGGWLNPRVQYSEAIPERVIELASTVLAHLPDAKFMVSDYETKKPDPFLAVTTTKMAAAGKYFIIACWDEPAYSEPEPPSIQIGPRT